MFNLENKRILITGASRGLGAVCARALAEQDTRLVLIARSEEKLREVKRSCKNSQRHLAIACNLTDMVKLSEAIGKVKRFLKEVDVVLHVVGGGLGLRTPLLSANDLLRLFTLNVVVAAEINRILLPEMIKRGSGNLVHVASIASSEATGSVGYNTAKAALAAYVRTLGRQTCASGVVVTGISPGGFYAPENSWERMKSQKPEAVKKFIKQRLPRGFLGRAGELIPMILLLCSEAASMMSGCLVPMDAGEGMAYNIND